MSAQGEALCTTRDQNQTAETNADNDQDRYMFPRPVPQGSQSRGYFLTVSQLSIFSVIQDC
jgi:hypothetical protein